MEKYKLANGWTKKKVMAQVKKHNNGTRSRSKDSARAFAQCVYLNAEGNRCAIGCFLPAGHPGLLHKESVVLLLRDFPDLGALMPFKEITQLRDFQQAHDCAKNNNVYECIQDFLDRKVEE